MQAIPRKGLRSPTGHSAPIGKTHVQGTEIEPRSTQAQEGKGEDQRLAAFAEARRHQGAGEYEEQLGPAKPIIRAGHPVLQAPAMPPPQSDISPPENAVTILVNSDADPVKDEIRNLARSCRETLRATFLSLLCR